MFRKPFHTKSNAAMKGSDKRKLKTSVLQQFAEITMDQVTSMFPTKAQTTVMKIQVHAGDNVLVYCVDGVPIFFEHEKLLYPTVYILWRYPSLLPCITSWPPVIEKMRGGADLMLPGVVVSHEGLPHLEKYQMCAVNAVGNLAPVAVGTAALSSSDMVASGMKGKCVFTWHCYGDHLWEAGAKSSPPQINHHPESTVTPDEVGQNSHSSSSPQADPGGNAENKEDLERTWEDGGGEENEEGITTREDEAAGVDAVSDEVAALSLTPEESIRGAVGGVKEGAEEEEEEETISPAEAMDQLLYQCLLHSLKRKVKPSELPLLTSTLYRNYIQACCPEGKTLDIKKSSYKKLSKFLQAMAVKGLLEVRETSKGVDSVMAIHKDHEEIRSFVPPDDESGDQADDAATPQADTTSGPEGPPEIRAFYAVTPGLVPVLQPSGYHKGSWLTKDEVRNAMTAYVKNNELVDSKDYGRVILDPLLHDAAINKSEGSVSSLKWDQLFTRCLHKMTAGHQVVIPGQPAGSNPPIQKGKVMPITMKLQRKAGNKWITIICNLEQFSIDPREFSHRLQVGVAASSSVGEAPHTKSGLQVTVQGKQIRFIEKLLTGHYKLHRRYIEGLELAPKGKKR